MTKSELAELVDFIGKKFDAQNRRFDAIEGRLDCIEERLGNAGVGVTYLRNRFDRFKTVFTDDRLDVQRGLKALEN